MVKRAKQSQRPISPIVGEVGTISKQAPNVVALGYPAPYSVAASSLGAQTVYRTLNQYPDLACSRFFMPPSDEPIPRPLVTAETGRPVADATAIAFSVSCETELLGVVSLLRAISLRPLADERTEKNPPVVIGGPITYVDPRIVAPLADLVAVGESEEILIQLAKALISARDKSEFLDAMDKDSTAWIPSKQQSPPQPLATSLDSLPAVAATWSPKAEFNNLFLVEATRGCKRGCTFCVLSRKAKGKTKFRSIPIKRILGSIPKDAPGVGLVGAAVTDHPEIVPLVRSIVDTGKRVSLSSIRADRLTETLIDQLKRGGLRTLTVAADGSSDRLRKTIRKGLTANHLLDAASMAKSAGLKGIKVYNMLGLPGETDDDVADFSDLALKMARHLRVSIAAQAFVPKPGTPLEKEAFAGEAVVRSRLKLMKKLIKGRVRLMPTSPRWSWLDWRLAHAGENAARIAIDAHKGGGTFAAWRKAVLKYGF